MKKFLGGLHPRRSVFYYSRHICTFIRNIISNYLDKYFILIYYRKFNFLIVHGIIFKYSFSLNRNIWASSN